MSYILRPNYDGSIDIINQDAQQIVQTIPAATSLGIASAVVASHAAIGMKEAHEQDLYEDAPPRPYADLDPIPIDVRHRIRDGIASLKDHRDTTVPHLLPGERLEEERTRINGKIEGLELALEYLRG